MAAANEGGSKNVSGGASIDRLDVEPYLQPMEVKRVLGQSIGQSMRARESHRNMPGFMSMRSPRKTGQLTIQLVRTSPPEQRTNSLDRRTHRRTHSNPHVLEAVGPQLPPRNSEITPVHKHFASDGCCSPMSAGESSLEFSSAMTADSMRKLVIEKPLPPIPSPDLSSSGNSAVLRNQIITSKSMDIDGDDGDNLSQQSGPFDEIEEGERKKMAASLPDLLSPNNVGAPPIQKGAAGKKGKSRSEDDQYAQIEEFQYMKMNSAPFMRTPTKGKMLPAQSRRLDEDVPLAPPFITRPHSKSISSSQISQFSGVPSKPPQRRETIAFIKQRFKHTIGNETIPEELFNDEVSSTHLSKHTITQDIRPLPPSPDKQLSDSRSLVRKISNGSNIYEVIDDEFKNDLKNRPSRQGSRRDYLAEWAPPVDHSLWVGYLEATRDFFNLPQVQELWVDTIKSKMKDVDPEEIFPPYHNVDLDKLTARLPPTLPNVVEEPAVKQPEAKENERSRSVSPLEPQGKLLNIRGTVPPANTPDSLEGRIHIASGKPPGLSENKVNTALSPNDIIYAINQYQHYDSDDEMSSDSDEEEGAEMEEEVTDSDEYDSDLDSSFARLPQLRDQGGAIISTSVTAAASSSSRGSGDDTSTLTSSVSNTLAASIPTASTTTASVTTASTSTSAATAKVSSSSITNNAAGDAMTVTNTNQSTPPSSPAPPLPPHEPKDSHRPEVPLTLPEDSQPSDSSTPSTPSRTVPPIPPRPKPKPKPKPLREPTSTKKKPEPIVTMDLRAMDSNDSDIVSTDSAITKSPRSVGGSGDFDLDHMTSEEGEGVEVVHNVKPSQFLKKRGIKLNSQSRKSRIDSGNFEEDTLPHTPTT